MISGLKISDFSGSCVPAEVISAYLGTHFHFRSERPVTLLIGRKNEELSMIFADLGVSSASVITAWNPFSESFNHTDNIELQARLIARLNALGLRHLSGEGVDSAGEWPPEDSLLVFDVDQATASEIGQKFRQNAIVWVGSDFVPHLIMLR